MKILIQECQKASVLVGTEVVGQIARGEVIFVGFKDTDNPSLIDKMINKMLKLRIFPDEMMKTNLTLEQISGEILAISQFTLYADVTQGNRPSFVRALNGERAKYLYDYFIAKLKEKIENLQTGIFGADMKVHLVNDGPFTVLLDSEEIYHE